MKKSLLMLVAAVPLLAACGASSVSQSDVEDKTKEQLSSTFPDGVEKVDCPEDLKAEKGETMECTATVGGEELEIVLEVTSVEDNTAEWTIDLADDK
jgi:uncharacterized lipoprotein